MDTRQTELRFQSPESPLEHLPQKLLATNCACCGRPMHDAESVNIGIGPECRKRSDWNTKKASSFVKEQANGWVLEVALKQTPSVAVKACQELVKLGFTRLATTIMARFSTVVISEESGCYMVRSPYNEQLISRFKRLRNARWDRQLKVWTFPSSAKTEVWHALCTAFPAAAGYGPRGAFMIPSLRH